MEEKLRHVTSADKRLIYEWANERSVRINSFSSEQISWEQHSVWFDRMIRSRDVFFWIYQHDAADVGQVRLQNRVGKWSISYSISVEYRGKGYGARMLRLMEHAIREIEPHAILHAEVKGQNLASQRVFERLGYTLQVESSDKKIYEKEVSTVNGGQ